MSDEINQDTAAPPAQRPRSPRVPVNFPVELEGRTTTDKPFRVNAEAERVSRGGATLITEIDVEQGTVVQLTPPFGRALSAEVNGVWIDAADGRQRIGIKLLEENGWFAE